MKKIVTSLMAVASLGTLYGVGHQLGNEYVYPQDWYKAITIRDTSKLKNVVLPEVAVAGVKSVQFIGLGRLKHNTGYSGITGDRIAVYIAHPATTAVYQVTAITLDVSSIHSENKFEEGELNIRLHKAIDANHPPADSTFSLNVAITPQMAKKARKGYLELPLATPILLPESGLFIVAAWKYKRNAKDEVTREVHGAALAATWDLSESYTWTSVGDLRQTWQHEGDKNSITDMYRQQGRYPNKVYNALMGVKVQQVD